MIEVVTPLATSAALEVESGEAAIPTTVDPFLKLVTIIVALTLVISVLRIVWSTPSLKKVAKL